MLPLDGLYTILEKENFTISLDTRLRIEKVLQARDENFLQQTKDLKFVLGSLIAKSQLEQEKFYRIFDRYYDDLLPEKSKTPDSTEFQIEFGEAEEKITQSRYWFYLLDFLLVVLIIGFFIPQSPEKPKTYFEVVDTIEDSRKIRTITKILVNKTPYKKNVTFKWWFALEDDSNMSDSVYMTRPPDMIFNKDSLYYEFGTSGRYRVILNASTSNEIDSTYSRTVSVEDTTPPILKITLPDREPVRIDTSNFEYVLTNKFQWYLLYGLLFIWFIWELIVRTRTRGYFLSKKIKNEFVAGDAPPYYLPFQSKDKYIDVDSRMYDLANHLRQRRARKASELDVYDSIKRTIKKRGFPQLTFKEKSKPSEYLILIDQITRRNHSSQLFSFLAQFLVSEDVYIEYYYFDSDPRVCWNELHPKGLSINDLTNKYSDYRLVIFGNGNQLIDDVFKPKLKDWVEKSFGSWKDRAIVTPTSFSKWNYAEEFLEQQFAVVPASLNGQLHLVNQMMYPNVI